jgi:pimeloyl-ACP methyl ester carboxylesterase
MKTLRPIIAAAVLAIALAACASSSAQPVQAAAQTDHFFESRGARLHGRLFTPEGPGPFPTVVYVTGGGSYSLLSDAYALNTVRAFNDRGIAMFVFDKPGFGQSGGTPEDGNINGKRDDAIAAINLMRTLPQVDQRCTIVWALSAAGWYAPQAIQGREDVCGLILVSPAGANPADYYAEIWFRRPLARGGVSGAALDEAVSLYSQLLRYQGSGENYEALRAAMVRAEQQPWFASAIALDTWQGLPRSSAALLAPDALRAAWAASPAEYAWFLERENWDDYSDEYASVRQPVLLVYGSIDSLIDPPASRAIFERAWAGRDDVAVSMYMGAGHGIQTRATGAEHPTPPYLDQITSWARLRFEAAAAR